MPKAPSRAHRTGSGRAGEGTRRPWPSVRRSRRGRVPPPTTRGGLARRSTHAETDSPEI